MVNPAFMEVAEHLPTNGKQQINSLFFFLHSAFALPTELLLSQPTSSHTLPFQSSLPPHLGRERENGCVALS